MGTRMKSSGEQFDERIAEVVWATYPDREPHWRLMRLRDDKPEGNYIDTVESICRSIADGVEQADVSPCLFPYIAPHTLPHTFRDISINPALQRRFRAYCDRIASKYFVCAGYSS